mgnify:CR=1 FL=1
MKYKRVLLKLSGESLMGDKNFGISPNMLVHYSKQIKAISDLGVEVAVVIGGGNIFRGLQAEDSGIERVQGDYMGMLATIINGMALQSALESIDIETRLLTAIRMEQVAEPYIRRKAMSHLNKGRVVIFGGGTGNPYFSTDTTSALRAAEIGAGRILMAKNGTDGVYDKDPRTHKDAKKYVEISHQDVLELNLGVMDSTAAALCKDNGIEIIVFDMNKPGNLLKILNGDNIGTLVH